MSKSLLLASLMVAGVYAQSTPDPSLIKGGEFQHLGCVAIKPGTFPRQFDLGQAGCTSSCSTNGNIIAFHGKSCSCDRLDLSPKPIPYQVTKVDNSLCNQWCDPADKSKGTCGGATVRGWPVYDLYKRNDARVVFVPFPGDVATPVAPGQTPAPVPNDPGHKPGDVFHDCPPGVTDCPYRTQCPGGNCGGSKPIPQPCNGCSPPSGGGKNWTAPGCPPGGCPPGQNPTPGGGDQNGQGNQGGNGGNGDNGGQGGDNNGGAGGNGDGQDSGNGSQGGQSDSGSSGNGGDSGSGGSDSQSGSDATGGQDSSGQDGAGQGQGSDGTDSGSSAGGSGGSDQGSSGQGGQDDQSGCTGSACPTPVSLGIKAEAGSLMFAVVAGVLVGLW